MNSIGYKFTDRKDKDINSNIHRCIAHIVQNDVGVTRTKLRELSDNTQIRINYIIKKISKEEMATKIYRNNTLRQKYTEMLHIYELISSVGIDFFQSLISSSLTGEPFYTLFTTKVEEFHKLRVYCNEQFAIISNTYSQAVPQIDENFSVDNKKFTIKKIKDNGKGKDQDQATDTNVIIVD